MKPLKPSHREKKRYLLVKGKDANKKTVDEAVLEYLGVLGFAETSPQTIKSGKEKIIISINRKNLEKVRASLVMSGKDLEVIRVSGSVGKLK